VIDEDRECKKNFIERSFLQRRRETATLINLYFSLFNLILISIIFYRYLEVLTLPVTHLQIIYSYDRNKKQSHGMQASG